MILPIGHFIDERQQDIQLATCSNYFEPLFVRRDSSDLSRDR